MIRIKAELSCFGRYKVILCDQKLLLSFRRRMYDQCVIPTMNYGAETWTTTKYLEQKFKSAQAMDKHHIIGQN